MKKVKVKYHLEIMVNVKLDIAFASTLRSSVERLLRRRPQEEGIVGASTVRNVKRSQHISRPFARSTPRTVITPRSAPSGSATMIGPSPRGLRRARQARPTDSADDDAVW